jgi:hypothetical protein
MEVGSLLRTRTRLRGTLIRVPFVEPCLIAAVLCQADTFYVGYLVRQLFDGRESTGKGRTSPP